MLHIFGHVGNWADKVGVGRWEVSAYASVCVCICVLSFPLFVVVLLVYRRTVLCVPKRKQQQQRKKHTQIRNGAFF